MSSYQDFKRGCNQDVRSTSDYRPTINVPRGPTLIPARKRSQGPVSQTPFKTPSASSRGPSKSGTSGYWNYGSRPSQPKYGNYILLFQQRNQLKLSFSPKPFPYNHQQQLLFFQYPR